MRNSRRFIRSLFSSVTWWTGVTISFVLFLLATKMVESKAEAQFNYHANNAQLALQTRIQSYIDVLQGARALFYTKDKITRDQFHSYVHELNLQQSFPGIDNLNFAQHVAPADKNAFEVAVRNDVSLDPLGYPSFSIKPPGDRFEYHPLTYQWKATLKYSVLISLPRSRLP
jgi:CHASE1-domain containing sensor protein